MPKITIKDIAAKAGVSKTAVSFAFNKPDQLSEATLQRILAVADELGYTPDPVASNLKTRQTGCIGLLVPQPLPLIARNPHMLAKAVIIIFMLVILYSLGSAFIFMVKDKGHGDRALRRLMWRIGLSLVLLLVLYIMFQMGWIESSGGPINLGRQ